MELFAQIVGWVGTLLVIAAYFLISNKKIKGDNDLYEMMNLFGAIGVGINVFYQRAWPAVALQVVWGIIAIASFVKTRK